MYFGVSSALKPSTKDMNIEYHGLRKMVWKPMLV